MEKIRYSTNMIFVFDNDNLIVSPLEPTERVNSSDRIFIYTDYNNFMKYKPPCKECLVCNMCVKEDNNTSPVYCSDPHLYIKICNKLRNFINGNKLFYIKELE